MVDYNTNEERLIEKNNYTNLNIVCFDINNPDFIRRDNSGLDCDLRVYFVAESGRWKVLNENLMIFPRD